MLYLFHLKACSKMDQLAKQFNISGGKKKKDKEPFQIRGRGVYLLQVAGRLPRCTRFYIFKQYLPNALLNPIKRKLSLLLKLNFLYSLIGFQVLLSPSSSLSPRVFLQEGGYQSPGQILLGIIALGLALPPWGFPLGTDCSLTSYPEVVAGLP